jgi:hypothetical protein
MELLIPVIDRVTFCVDGGASPGGAFPLSCRFVSVAGGAVPVAGQDIPVAAGAVLSLNEVLPHK